MASVRASAKFGGGGGINFTDPREFSRNIVGSGVMKAVPDATASPSSAATAGFFTEMANRGVADNTSWTADTYKTILSISSGIGYLYSLVGPTGLAGTPTTTFEITVDGVLTTVAVAQTTTAQRAVLGPLIDSNAGDIFTSAKFALAGPVSVNAGKDTALLGTDAGAVIPQPIWFRQFGVPCLVYRTSLLIRMKTSESNSTTTNQERQSAVQYVSMT